MPRLIRAAFLASLLLGGDWRELAAAELPAAWPEGWKKAYARFESFIADQKKYFPSAGLEFLPDGTILTGVADQEAASLVFFRSGLQILSMCLGDSLFGQGRGSRFTPGAYAAFLQTTVDGGYKTLYPIVWFRVEAAGENNRGGPRVRMIDPPSTTADIWPDERLLRFRDFHNFPKGYSREIHKENTRISPNVILAVTPSGKIVRGKLDSALETSLRWRIYRDGRLVERGPAGNDLNRAFDIPGDYFALVGIDGPGGFMPVSNYLKFPLFPTKSGGVEVFPTVTNPERIPDFLRDVLPPDVLTEVLSQEWAQGGGYYNMTLLYALNSSLHLDDPRKQALLYLWGAWAFELRDAWDGKKWQDSNTGILNIAPEPR